MTYETISVTAALILIMPIAYGLIISGAYLMEQIFNWLEDNRWF